MHLLRRHRTPRRGNRTSRLPDIPGYRVEDVLGHGGIGVVYRAVTQPDPGVEVPHDTPLGVRIKTSRPGLTYLIQLLDAETETPVSGSEVTVHPLVDPAAEDHPLQIPAVTEPTDYYVEVLVKYEPDAHHTHRIVITALP